jgi:hypothetical protein
MLYIILLLSALQFARQATAQEMATEISQITPTKKVSRITNGIQKKDLAYYKFFSNHYPAVFTISVNGAPISEGETIATYAKTLDIEYHYEWKTPTGKRINTKHVRYTLPIQTSDFTINFSGWHEDERIVIPGAQKMTQETEI